MELPHEPGDIVRDRYRIVGLLGEGGSGATYEASDLQSNKCLALKALSLKGMSDWKAVELFEREAKVLAELNHIAIPRYLEYFHVDEPSNRAFYIAQELAPGESLAALVEKGWRTNEEEVRRIAAEILEILVYLHDLKPAVIHRDIKPQNIIRASDGRIFLVDFGAVRQSYQTTMARGSTVVGTFGYMAPEQFIGQAVEATDLYGLGATLLFLLSHHSPADLPVERLKINFRDRVEISSSFADWLEEMLEPDIEERFSSAKEALSALRGESKIAAVKAEPLPWKALVGVGVAAIAAIAVLNSFKWGIVSTFGLTPRGICKEITVVRSYLQQGGNPNARLYNPNHGANPNRRKGSQLLHCASELKKPDIAELLIANGADVNAKDKYGYTPLHHAALLYGNLQTAELLIASGADVNANSHNGETPLHSAAGYGEGETVELLIAKGADINARNDRGRTPLNYATRQVNWKTAELLAAKGADVNAKDKSGNTPLHYAALEGNSEIVKLLISKGADVNAKNNNERVPLHRPAFQGKWEIVDLLIANGADINANNKHGYNLLHWAASHENSEMVELLIAKGADVNVKNSDRETPLHRAADRANFKIAELLIAKGADVNALDNSGASPLHHAALQGNWEIVELLIASGADVNILDKRARTPLSFAVQNSHVKTIKIIKNYGGKYDKNVFNFKMHD